MAIDLGIDIGTSSVQVYNAAEDKIIANEPTVVAVNENREIVAVGSEAEEMAGKTPEGYTVIRPVQSGGITNFDMAVGLLKNVIESGTRVVFSKIRAAISVPSGVSDVEKQAV